MERYNRINRISVIQSQSAQEVLDAEKLDVLGALVLSGNDVDVTINSAHAGVDNYVPETMNIRDYVNKRYSLEGKVSPLSVVNSPTVTLQGKISVNNGKQGVANAIKRNYPNLDITVNNDEGIVFFKDAEVEKLVKARMQEIRNAIGYNGVVTLALLNKEWALNYVLSNTTIEYFNEYALFRRANAFSMANCPNLKEVTLPSRMTTLPNGFFANDVQLQRVNLDAITIFFTSCLENCPKLVLSSINPNTTQIQNGAFSKSSRVTLSSLPNTLTLIGQSAFRQTGVTISEIPSNVTSVGDWAFNECLGITTMDFKASVAILPRWCFYGCSNMGSITLHDGLTTIGEGSLRGSGITSLDVPSTVVDINKNACYQCSSLATLTLRSGLKTIGNSAFCECAITTLVLPNGLETIEGNAFYGNNITSITIPSTLKIIEKNAFYDCRNALVNAMVKTDANNKRYVDWRGYEKIEDGNFGVNGTPNKFDYLLFDGVSMGVIMSSSSTMGDENGANTASCTKVMFDGTLSEYFSKYNNLGVTTPLALLDTTDNSADAGFWLKDSNGEWSRLPSEITVPSEITEFSNSLFRSVKDITSVIAPQVTQLGYRTFYENSALKRFNSRKDGVFYFPNFLGSERQVSYMRMALVAKSVAIYPKVVYASQYITQMVETVDFGTSLNKMANLCWNSITQAVIFRSLTPPICTSSTFYYTPSQIFVPQSVLETYKTDSFFYRYRDIIFAIGGAEWVARYGSANEYADYPDGSQNSSLLINN